MHSISVSVRLIALLVVAIAAVLAFASLSPSQPRQAEATITQPVLVPNVSCSDIYIDFPPLVVKGQPHGPEDLLVAKSLNRLDNTQPANPKQFITTSVSYLGPDLKDNDESAIGDLVPDKGPTIDPCGEKRTSAKQGPEANQMNLNTDYNMISNYRPGTLADLVKKAGPPVSWNLEYSTCVFSEANKQWVRTDINLIISDVTPNEAINYGTVVLNLGTTGPTTSGIDVDGDTKDDVGAIASQCANQPGTIPFPSVLESFSRSATTDFPLDPKNVAAGIPADPDGVSGPDADTLADDWDGDGCPDWDELDPDFPSGRDPFNPNDCDKNFTGAYTALATVQAATEGTAGSYFHAIVAIEHNKVNNDLTGALQVYLDSTLLSGAGPKNPETPATRGSDGNPGAPPPPPYTLPAPTVINGVFDKINNLLILDFCVANLGGLFAPNVVAHVEVDANTLKGTVEIHGNQTQAACALKTFNNTVGTIGQPIKIGVPPQPPVAVQLAQQGVNQNHDKDKCTDMEELLDTVTSPRPGTCGDDPYNPNDSDENFSAVGNLLVTVYNCGTGTIPNCGFGFNLGEVGGADWNKTLGQIIPGSYYHCITDTQHDKVTNGLNVRAFCYIDGTNPVLSLVNSEACPGVLGDGIAGAGPPWPAAKNPGPYQECWADTDDNQTKLAGTYDPADGHLHIEGCFADKDGFGAQGNVYTVSTIDASTGQGQTQLTILIADQADCEAGPPFATGAVLPVAKLETVEQANKEGNSAGYDTDGDGCSDKEELSDDEVFGGLRDPYKYWDFYDPTQNRAIGFSDFLALVTRVGAVDLNNTTPINRHSSPFGPVPPPPAYHPKFDRGGQQPGANPWSELAPNGSIGFPDFLSMIRQVGHTCRPEPNDPKYPYKL